MGSSELVIVRLRGEPLLQRLAWGGSIAAHEALFRAANLRLDEVARRLRLAGLQIRARSHAAPADYERRKARGEITWVSAEEARTLFALAEDEGQRRRHQL